MASQRKRVVVKSSGILINDGGFVHSYLCHSLELCIMTTTLTWRLWQRPYWPVLSPRYFLATATFGPHSVPWQPWALFGRVLLFLLSVLELPLHWAKHCSNLWPAAALLQSGRGEGGRKPFTYGFYFSDLSVGSHCFFIILKFLLCPLIRNTYCSFASDCCS